MAYRTPQFAAELGVRLGGASSSASAHSTGMNEADDEEEEVEEEDGDGMDAGQEDDDEDGEAEMGNESDEGDENANPQKLSGKGKGKAAANKKANLAKIALAKKQKQKMLKLEAAAKSKKVAAKAALDEKGVLSKALSLSFRPLRPEVALVLAWPVLQRVEHDTAGNTIGLLSESQQGHHQLPSSSEKEKASAALNFNVVKLLLTDVHAHLSRALAPPKVGFGGNGGALAAARQAKLAASGGGASGSNIGSTSGNSVFGNNSDAKADSTCNSSSLDSNALLALYLNGGVFGSLHGLLGRLELALVDDLHEDDEQYARFTCMAPAADDEGHPDAWPCFELLLRTVTSRFYLFETQFLSSIGRDLQSNFLFEVFVDSCSRTFRLKPSATQ